MAVFVLDKRGKPLMPCSERRARLMLERGRARVHRLRPFVIRLIDRYVEDSVLQPLSIKIDPGSKGTGVAVVLQKPDGTHAVRMLVEVQHRGASIRDALTVRRAHRRFRRGKLRYRPARFDNRTKPKGWLAPSLRHRVDTVTSWHARLCRWAPVTHTAVERVRFDTQLLENPEISGIGYQQGTLAGTEVREYVLERDGRTCSYCDKTGVPLNLDHIEPKARGGSDRVSNLTLACIPCNECKGSLPVEQFVRDPARLARILKRAKAPLRDAAAVNATRWALWRALVGTGLPVEAATGGRTKWNRIRFGIPKSHASDAACAGACEGVTGWQVPVLAIRATGRGAYQRTRLTAHGFPRGYLTHSKRIHGFATGDLVRAQVPSGKKAGAYTGRVAVRASGSFNISVGGTVVQGIGYRHCVVLQRADGYGYSQQPKQEECAPPRPEGRGLRASAQR